MHNKKIFKDKENFPTKEKMHPKWRSHGREVEITKRYFNFLHRLLRKSIGRKWNDVYSELKEIFIKNNHLEMFTEEYISRFICINPIYKNGEIYRNSRNVYAQTKLSNDDLYVNSDGIITAHKTMTYKQIVRKNEQEKLDLVTRHNGFIADGLWFVQRNGVWYIADVVKQQIVPTIKHVYDTALKAYVPTEVLAPKYKHAYGYTGKSVDYGFRRGIRNLHIIEHDKHTDPVNVAGANVAINKRICCSKILKKHGLVNDIVEDKKGPGFYTTSDWNGRSFVEYRY